MNPTIDAYGGANVTSDVAETTLPFTGSDPLQLAVVGILLVLAGLAWIWVLRTR